MISQNFDLIYIEEVRVSSIKTLAMVWSLSYWVHWVIEPLIGYWVIRLIGHWEQGLTPYAWLCNHILPFLPCFEPRLLNNFFWQTVMKEMRLRKMHYARCVIWRILFKIAESERRCSGPSPEEFQNAWLAGNARCQANSMNRNLPRQKYWPARFRVATTRISNGASTIFWGASIFQSTDNKHRCQ